MAVGNTFSATALSSYGAFWISMAITYTPGGFKVMATLEEADGGSRGMFYDSFGSISIRMSQDSPHIDPNLLI